MQVLSCENIEKMRGKYLRRVGSDKKWLLGNHRLICSAQAPTKREFWLGLLHIGLFQFHLHQTICLLLQFHIVIISFSLDSFDNLFIAMNIEHIIEP